MQFATRNWLRTTMYKQNTCNLPTESSRFKHCVCSWSNRCCDSQTKFQMFTFYYFLTWPKDWSPLKLIVFFVHLNGFYTHLNESNIVKILMVLSISLRSKRSPTKSFCTFWSATAKNTPCFAEFCSRSTVRAAKFLEQHFWSCQTSRD